MRICVFCSANDSQDSKIVELAEGLGRWAAEKGHTVVFGGHDAGLMHAVSKTAHDGGGKVVGVVPRVIEQRGKLSPFLDVHIPTDNLSDRKDLMVAQSDAFIVLPGGVGTLDELFTVAAQASLGYHGKPIILYNMCHFWDSLVSMLDDLQQKGVMRGNWRDSILVAHSTDDIDKLLR